MIPQLKQKIKSISNLFSIIRDDLDVVDVEDDDEKISSSLQYFSNDVSESD